MPKIPKYVKTTAKFILSFGILAFVFYKIDLDELMRVFLRVQLLYLIPAALFFILSKLVAAYRLNLFLGRTGIKISNNYNTRLYLLGMFYNLFLPGGIGGDGYKIFLLNRRFKIKAKKIFWAILLDRVMGMLALFCLAAILGGFIPALGVYRNYIWILAPLGVMAYFIFIRYLFGYFSGIFLVTLGQSFLVQTAQVVSAVFILLSVRVGTDLVGYIFVFLLSSIVAAFPITIGGIGSREVTFLFGAEMMQLDISNSIALSLLFYIITALVSLSGIYFSIRTDKLDPGVGSNFDKKLKND